VIIVVEVEELAVESGDLVADLFQERLEAGADPAGVGEPGELVQVDPEARELPHHRERGSGGQDGDTPMSQEVAQIGREVERGGGRPSDRGRIVLGKHPEEEVLREPQVRRQ
jgi:hypothetical protein